MKTVIEIVKAGLTSGGFDGLVAEGGECGCELSDLAPCGGDFSSCIAGFKHMDPRPGHENDWAIWPRQRTPTQEEWEGVQY